MPMERIADLFAAEQLRTMECGPEQGLIKNWQDSLKQQQTAGMPAHEVDVSKPPEQDGMAEAMRNVFLHQAAGGPKEGFTTKNPRSHAVAQSLAKTGHLKKVGEFKHANNQSVHHWQLTEKGLAHAQTGGQGGFPVSYPKAAGGMAVPTKSPGDPSKGMSQGAPGGAPGATAKNGIGQPDPKQKFKVAAGGPGSGRHPEGGMSRAYDGRAARKGIHEALKQNGFKIHHIEDHGTGRFAQTTQHYKHPDGHTAVLSRSEGDARSNFVNVQSSDEYLNGRLGRAFSKAGAKA